MQGSDLLVPREHCPLMESSLSFQPPIWFSASEPDSAGTPWGGNRTGCVLSCLAYFTRQQALKVLPCCSLSHSVLPFQGTHFECELTTPLRLTLCLDPSRAGAHALLGSSDT